MKKRAPRNKTLTCTKKELDDLSGYIKKISEKCDVSDIGDQLINGNIFDIHGLLPRNFVDLLILDPPYNLTKSFNGHRFHKMDKINYVDWFTELIIKLIPLLKENATIYVCSEWKTSSLISPILEEYFFIRNRITWEREKGRGAKNNWKNNSEDIWFCTKSDTYYFDVDSVKQKRTVLAPYKNNGEPKDWKYEKNQKYRMTHPSNLWTDLTVPFWSMPENTDHPTQKPEKMLAKLILASSQQGDFVFDPFVGSGTSVVVANKMNRRWCGVDRDMEYLCWAKKRIINSETNKRIQGYEDGVFWERNAHKTRCDNNNSPSEQTKILL